VEALVAVSFLPNFLLFGVANVKELAVLSDRDGFFQYGFIVWRYAEFVHVVSGEE